MDIRLLLPLFALSASSLFATDYLFVDEKDRWHIDANVRGVGKAKMRSHPVRGTHATYVEGGASVFYSQFLDPNNSLTWRLGYSAFKFDWPENPRFRREEYNYAVGSVAVVSNSIERWRWVLSLGTSVDTKDFNFGQTAVYYGLFWGRYHWRNDVGLHIGFVGNTGMNNNYVFPILGFDWQINQKWKINAIFPLNMSIEYFFNQHWSTSAELTCIGGPTYRTPRRAHEGIGEFHKAIFEIYSKGVDLNLRYKSGKYFTASIGGGWDFGGWILIRDQYNHNGKYYKFDGAPYVQANVGVTF